MEGLKPARAALLLAAAAVLPHLASLGHGFVWLDQGDLVEGRALGGALEVFGRGYAHTGFYRPLVALAFSLDAALGPAPWHFHLSQLVLFAAVVLAFWSLVLRLSTPATALVAGLLVAVHPLSGLVAQGLLFRPELLCALFLLLAAHAHLRGRIVGAALALFAAALSKETAFVLGPLWLVTVDRRWRLVVLEGLGLLAAFGLRLAFAPAWRASSPEAGLATKLSVLATAARRLVDPVDLSVCDAHAVATFADGATWLGLAVLLVVALAAWKGRPPHRWLALALLPLANLVPTPRLWSPHLLFLALLPFAWLVAEATAHRRHVWLALVALLLFASAREPNRWRDDVTLFTAELREHPSCRQAHFQLGVDARAHDDWPRAGLHFERALAGTPGVVSFVDEAATLQNLAEVRLHQGRALDAEGLLGRALGYPLGETERREVRHDLAVALAAQGAWKRVDVLLEPETSRPDAFEPSLVLRAKALVELGRLDEAEALWRRARP